MEGSVRWGWMKVRRNESARTLRASHTAATCASLRPGRRAVRAAMSAWGAGAPGSGCAWWLASDGAAGAAMLAHALSRAPSSSSDHSPPTVCHAVTRRR